MNDFRFIVQVSKGLIRDHRGRRALMFYNLILVLVMAFVGSTFLWPWLRGHPFLFLGYWFLCAWLTLLAAGLAMYDLAKVRLEARETERRLKRELLGELPKDPPHDTDAH